MMTGRRSAFFLAFAVTIIWTSGAGAKPVPIDDSGSAALEPAVAMRWQTSVPRASAANLMVGTTTIRVRINVMPWLKRSARIYLSLPLQRPGPVGLSWLTQGQFNPGRVNSGNRVLVYSGPITTPFMEDLFKFEFSVDGRLLPRAVPITYHFEMDED